MVINSSYFRMLLLYNTSAVRRKTDNWQLIIADEIDDSLVSNEGADLFCKDYFCDFC